AAWWSNQGRTDVINGLNSGDSALVISGARSLLKEPESFLNVVEIVLSSERKEVIPPFLAFLSNEYVSVDQSGTELSCSSTMISALRAFQRENKNGLGEGVKPLITSIEQAIADARRLQSERMANAPPRVLDDAARNRLCVHICKVCRPCCPAGTIGKEPKRNCGSCIDKCALATK
ncbi:MAG: hypothetical protein ABIF01_01835, partial [Candidatus Micrarchaeota archaeon]